MSAGNMAPARKEDIMSANANDINFSSYLDLSEVSNWGDILIRCEARMEARGGEFFMADVSDWFKVGERRWGTLLGEASKRAVDAGNDRPYLFKHDHYVRQAILRFDIDVDGDTMAFGVLVTQYRYGKGGKIRNGGIEAGGVYMDRADLRFMVNAECPEWKRAAKALGL